jgi:signal transduction histidine kinase
MIEQKSYYDLLFQNVSDGALILSDDGLIIRMNPAAAMMLRCVPEACLYKTPAQAFTDQPALIALCEGAAGKRVPLPDKRIARGIGESMPEGGRLVLLRDVTEREALDSRREQLVQRIAHDLQNPLAAIEGFVELISLYGSLNPDQQRFVMRIRQTSQKLTSLVRTLVDLTWVEAGMPMGSELVYLDKVIAEAAGELSEDAKQKQMTIAISTQQPMPAVMGDPMRLRQVVYNLMHNAILYSEPEQIVAIHAFGEGQQVRCSVADRGMGIAEHELRSVFDRMYRSQTEQVRNLPGGGIGLTMVREILKRHGGSIYAESKLGEGSTFVFTLPTV